MAKNVYNTKEIDSWINLQSAAAPRVEVAKWIKSTVRSYILNNAMLRYEPVEEVEEGMPEWAVRGVEDGTLVKLDFDSILWHYFLEEFEHALMFVDHIRGSINVNFRDAVTEGIELIRARNAKSSEQEDWTGIETVITSTEGYTWASLSTKQALVRESKLMQHCVGHNDHYLKGIQQGVWKIYSLRDSNNKPHCTIQIRTSDNSVVQIRGKQNTGVVAKYQKACCEFLTWIKPSYVPEHDLRYLGLISIEGTVYNVTALPDGLEVQENLNLAGYGLLEKLPSNLTVHGNLSISRTSIRELPQGLYVAGSFSASGTPLKKLSEDAHFGGSINIRDTDVGIFPYKQVNGTLDIRGTLIESLPHRCSYWALHQDFMQLSPRRTKEREQAIAEQTRMSNDLVDAVLKQVSERINRKLAHELRMSIAKKSNKFEELMRELRERGIDVS